MIILIGPTADGKSLLSKAVSNIYLCNTNSPISFITAKVG